LCLEKLKDNGNFVIYGNYKKNESIFKKIISLFIVLNKMFKYVCYLINKESLKKFHAGITSIEQQDLNLELNITIEQLEYLDMIWLEIK